MSPIFYCFYSNSLDTILFTYSFLNKNTNTSINPAYQGYSEYKNNSVPEENLDYTLIDLLPTKEEPSMKNELKNFLKKQLHKSSGNVNNRDINGTSVTSLDSSTMSNFSPF